jgi:hypothetical protein
LGSNPITMDGASLGMDDLFALPTRTVTIGVQARVLRRVFVTAPTVRPVGAVVSAMFDDIAQVVGLGVPAQIAQAVVCGFTVDMAAERALGGRSDKRFKHQPVNAPRLLAPVRVQRDDHIAADGAHSETLDAAID